MLTNYIEINISIQKYTTQKTMLSKIAHMYLLKLRHSLKGDFETDKYIVICKKT